MVSCGYDASHDNSIDERARNLAAGHHKNDCEWRGVAVFRRQAFVGVRYIQADDQDREDVEDENPPEDVADNTRESLRGILRLSGCNGDRFCAAVCKGSCDEYRCEAADSADEWCVADVPVLSTNVFAGAVAAAVNSDT